MREYKLKNEPTHVLNGNKTATNLGLKVYLIIKTESKRAHTKCSNNKGFSSNSTILHRINACANGQ